MFALFFSLYLSMFMGTWQLYTLNGVKDLVVDSFNAFGKLITSTFNNVATPMTDLGTILTTTVSGTPYYLGLIAFVLATITSIGIVVMAVKGIKRVFSIFFMGIR